MEKKLPKVFVNQVNKSFDNNKTVYVASTDRKEEVKENSRFSNLNLKGMDINQKIRTIFHSKNYIYKADVEITRHGEKEVKKIIGKNGNNLITIDNEIIPIDTIEDIKLVN